MGGHEIDEISAAIGEMRATVQNLISMGERNDRDASEGRSVLHQKVDEMRKEMANLRIDVELKLAGIKSDIENVAGEVTRMKPSVDTFDRKHQQGIGSKRTIAAVWAGFVTVLAALTTGLVELVHYFLHMPPSPPPAH